MCKNTILVLEDEKPLLAAIEAKLNKEGFNVESARTVTDGLKKLKKCDTVSAIWLDHYLLGKEDGIDFMSELRKDKNHDDVPVIMVSNTASSNKMRTYFMMGISKYYTKAEHSLEEIIGDIKEIIAQGGKNA